MYSFLRFYGFAAGEILDDAHPDFNPLLDPKCNWAVNHMEHFPLEINKAPYEMLLRVPGIGVKSAMRIRSARRYCQLDFEGLKKLGVVLKRARYFITCKGKSISPLPMDNPAVIAGAISERGFAQNAASLQSWQGEAFSAPEQLSLFAPTPADKVQRLTGQI